MKQPAISFHELVARARKLDASVRKYSRDDCVAAAKEFLAERHTDIYEFHRHGGSGVDVVAKLTRVADELLVGAFEIALCQASKPNAIKKRVSLCALGGYGRGQLNPGSDLDVGLFYRRRLDKDIEKINKFMVPFLWDVGYENSFVVRSCKEAIKLAKEDPRVYTGLLECRLLYGIPEPLAEIQMALGSLKSKQVEELFAEIDAVRGRADSTDRDLYELQPNIKDSPGALRDYHVALWLAHARLGEATLDELEGQGYLSAEDRLGLAEALDFMWRVRNELHFSTGKCEDRLSFRNQLAVASALGYTDENDAGTDRLMEDYYSAARKIHRFLRDTARLCDSQPRGAADYEHGTESPELYVRNDELHISDKDPHWFEENPARLMSVIWECARRDVPLSHAGERMIRDNLELANEAFATSDLVRRFFLAICNRPLQAGLALRQAAESGLLDRYIPEFAAVRDIIRYEDFHHFPVDEHTLRAVEMLREIPGMEGRVGDFLNESLEHLSDPYILVLALLCHDLGKVKGEEHSIAGMYIAREICERLGLPQEDAERVGFLVEHHLLMTKIALYRDTDDEDVIFHFVNIIKSEERLRALFLLSFADMSAVGPNVWSEWKGSLLVKLYLRAEQQLLGRPPAFDDEFWKGPKAERAREMVAESMRDRVEDHIHAFGDRYSVAFAAPQIAMHVACVEEAEREGFAFRAMANDETTSEVVVCTRDHPGLFEKMAGCFAAQLIDVNRAAAFSSPDGMALDSFTVSGASTGRPLSKSQSSAVEKVLRKVLLKEEDLDSYVNLSRRRIFAMMQGAVPTQTRIHFDNDSSRVATVIDIEGADRTGLLYDIARALHGNALDIRIARIVTDARRVRDAFYVTTNGNKIEDTQQQDAVRETLLNAIHPRPAKESQGGAV